MAGMVTL